MAHADLQKLLDSLLPFAQSRISEHGDFHPFGAVMWVNGEIQWVAADSGEEFPPAEVLIDALTGHFKTLASSHEIRAAVICSDVVTIPPGQTDKTEAIRFSLEHRSGESLDVFAPHTKTGTDDPQYGPLFSFTRTPQFFTGE